MKPSHLLLLLMAGPALAQDGAALYAQHCATCHQADGAGTVGLAPPLKGEHWLRLGADRAYLPTVLVHGLSGAIKVGGQTFVGSMPPFAAQLDDAALAAVAVHVRRLQGATGEAPITAEDIRAQRDKPGSPPQLDNGACSCWAADEIDAVHMPGYLIPCLRMLLVAAAVLAAPTVSALGGQNMVLGRMVQPRGDAPSVAPTTHTRSRWVLHCAGCHGVYGAGSELGGVPDLRGIGAFLRVDGGREFVIKVPGVMGSGLDDAQVAEVTNWLLATLARESVPPGQRPYDAAEVARARAQPLTDVAAERQKLIDRARRQGVSLY